MYKGKIASPKPKGKPMKTAQRDLEVSKIIAEDVLGWEWNAGGWYSNNEFQTDYFDPMNDPKQLDMVMNVGLDIELTEANGGWEATAPNTDKETTGISDDKLFVSAPTKAEAICFVLCMMAGDNPANW